MGWQICNNLNENYKWFCDSLVVVLILRKCNNIAKTTCIYRRRGWDRIKIELGTYACRSKQWKSALLIARCCTEWTVFGYQIHKEHFLTFDLPDHLTRER